MKTILTVNEVTKQYRNNELILKEVSLEIEEGSFTVIIGPSGSGKSTLLNIMLRITKAEQRKCILRRQGHYTIQRT